MSTQASSGDGTVPKPPDTERITDITDQDSSWETEPDEPLNPETTRETPESGEGTTERTEEQPRPKRTKPKTSFVTPPTSPRGSGGSGNDDDSRNNGDRSSERSSWTSYFPNPFSRRGGGSGSEPSNPTDTKGDTAPPPSNPTNTKGGTAPPFSHPPQPSVEEVRDESERKPESGYTGRGRGDVRGAGLSRDRSDSYSASRGSQERRPQTPFPPKDRIPDTDEDQSSGSQGRTSISDIVKGLFRRKDTQPSATSTTPQNDTQISTTDGGNSISNGWGIRDRFGRFISQGTNALLSVFGGDGRLSNFGHMMSNPGFAGPHGLFDLMGGQGAYDPSARPFIDNRTVDDQIKQWAEPRKKLRERKGLAATATSANPSQLTSAFQPSTFGGLQSAMNGTNNSLDAVSNVGRSVSYQGKRFRVPANMTPRTAIYEKTALSEILPHARAYNVPTDSGGVVQKPVPANSSLYETLEKEQLLQEALSSGQFY